MNERTRQGLHVLAAALLLGALGDALLRATSLGLNFFLLTCARHAACCACCAEARVEVSVGQAERE